MVVLMRDGVYTRVADLLRELHTEARVETPVFTATQIRARALGLDQFGEGSISFRKLTRLTFNRFEPG